jgi:lipoyl synthase
MMEQTRRPDWLRKGKPITESVVENKATLAGLGLHTVCESARCPNLSECFQSGNATFLVMGDHCTRDCAFCAVQHGKAEALDAAEGRKIAQHMKAKAIRYAVITSVTRDDLPDGGAAHFAAVVASIRDVLPQAGLELLVPDFRGHPDSVAAVASLPIDVFGHNLETVRALYPEVRRGADYERSLDVLRMARAAGAAKTKSGIMVGLGESEDELLRLFDDLASAGVEILTIGQYLRPAWRNVAVARYVSPSEFDALADEARRRGIPRVLAGPYVRSSYMAESLFRKKI